MKTTLEQVKEFHEKFGINQQDKPYTCDRELSYLRCELIREELHELENALIGPGMLCNIKAVEVLDALLDLQYVLDGAFLALGFHKVKDAAFAEVHRSNMSKLGADGKPILRKDGKILKGPNYTPPQLEQFIYSCDCQKPGYVSTGECVCECSKVSSPP